jgi:hypothetical protein
MTALAAYRDDGPLAAWLFARAGEKTGRLSWIVPPLLRALEFGALVALTAWSDRGALPACYALLAVLAFHHYDTAYRLRHQGLAPPDWVRLAGGGWEGRLIVVVILAIAGVLEVGLIVLAAGLGLLYVGEAASSWARFARGRPPAPVRADDEEDVD